MSIHVYTPPANILCFVGCLEIIWRCYTIVLAHMPVTVLHLWWSSAGCGAPRRRPLGTGSPGSSSRSWGPSSRTRPCCTSPSRHPPRRRRRPSPSPRRRQRSRERSPLSRTRRSFADSYIQAQHAKISANNAYIYIIHNTRLNS